MSSSADASDSTAPQLPLVDVTLQVFSRVPVAGRVKTRLIERLGPTAVARLHAVLAERAIAAAGQLQAGAPGLLADAVPPRGPVRVRLELWLDGDLQHEWVTRQRAAVPSLRVYQQVDGDLGQRMHVALTHACANGFGILVGTDCPGVDASYLRQAVQALADGADVVLGPVEDGGYVLIGLRRPCSALFSDMAWSTDNVFQTTWARTQQLQLQTAVLPQLWDVDRPEDVDRLIELATRLNDPALMHALGLR